MFTFNINPNLMKHVSYKQYIIININCQYKNKIYDSKNMCYCGQMNFKYI